MAVQTQFRRGNTLSHSTFTGATGEVTIDTDKNVAVVHNGSTAGGFPLVKAQDLTTANVTEVSNQYFTNARSRAAISVTGAGTYDNTTGIITVTGGVTSVGGATGAVSNVQLANAIITSGLLTTANVNELNNLYFTNARVYANVLLLGHATNAQLGLYATNSQLGSYATNGQLSLYATTNYVSNALANLVASAPATLDTLNELAVALGNDNNFSTSILTIVGNKANTSVVTASFNQANTAFAQANVAINQANVNFGESNTKTTVAFNQANVAFAQANVAFAQANISFDTANLNFTSANTYVNARLLTKANIADLTTANVSELTNLYFTNARVNAALTTQTLGNATFSSNVKASNITTQTITDPTGSKTWTFGSDGIFTVPGNIVPSSNLVHNLGSPTNRWKDLYLSGNTIDLGGTTISSSAGGINFPEANITGNLYSGYITVVNSISANVWNKLYSANVIESTNLFYTNARVYANVSPMIDASFYQANTSFAQANISFATGNINYGLASGYANVAFAQANTAFAQANVSFATANANFTSANTYVNTRLLTKANIADLTTANVSELTNLYFTNARVYANIIDGNFATQSYVGTAISNLVASAPATLDTLNELATALGNDNNFSTSILTIVGNKANTSVVTASFNQANVSFNQANIAFAQANVAFAQANLKFNSSGGNITGDVSITGNFNPSVDVTYNLGTASKRWANLYLSGNTINLGGATISSTGSAISLPPSSSIGGQAISSFSGSYNDLTNKPANVISFSNTAVSYYQTYNVLSINKNLYRSGDIRYTIIDDNSNSYTSVIHTFIHANNVLSYSNTITLIGTEVHTSQLALVGNNIVLFLSTSNLYASNYFLESNNYQSNVTANIKGYVTLIEV